MSGLYVYTHPACLGHDTGPDHPESPERLAAVLEALHGAFPALDWREAPIAKLGDLRRVHDEAQIDAVLAADFDGYRMLDVDTPMCAGSRAAALRAAGAGVAAVDAVMTGQARAAFCAVRPPGHHASGSVSMGFCLFNNVAVGAAHALAAHELERVAIVDFDVHHGNGTQDIFWSEPRVMYASSHQWPLYPGTGDRAETGVGNIVNATLPAGAGSKPFRDAWENTMLPALDAFAPQLVLISAGFDAHKLDPLANLNLETGDYAWITHRLIEIARRHAEGRVVSSLEGGYSLDALRESVAAHVAALGE